jgi:peroxiredoxin
MKTFAGIALGVAIVAALVYFGERHRASSLTANAPPPMAPALTLVDLSGNKIVTSNYAGKVLLINFWAAWCTPCAEEIPQFIALQDKYRAQGLRMIGISMDDQDRALREFCEKYKVNYPVIAGNQKIAEAYGGILGLPTTFLIGRDGRIRAKYSGLADFAKLEQEIVAVLRTSE